jgi:hypothetical protein
LAAQARGVENKSHTGDPNFTSVRIRQIRGTSTSPRGQ